MIFQKMEQEIQAEFYNRSEKSRPGQHFIDLLPGITALENEKSVMLVEMILRRINECNNRYYLTIVYRTIGDFMEANMFFLIDIVNTSLENCLHGGDIKSSFLILKKIHLSGDARTVEILDRYIRMYRDKSVISRITGYRNRLARRVSAIADKIEKADIQPIITDYLEWQE